MATAAEAERAILSLLGERDLGKTICPSEAARALDADGFRGLMPLVREAASRLRSAGRLEVTQNGREVDPQAARGPIRLRLPADEPAPPGN